MKKALPIIGFIAFALGILLAVIFGIFPISPQAMHVVVIVLIILGVLVGVLNITTREILPLLIATVALIVVGNVFEPVSSYTIITAVDNVLQLIATLMAPAAVIAAIRALIIVGFPRDEL